MIAILIIIFKSNVFLIDDNLIKFLKADINDLVVVSLTVVSHDNLIDKFAFERVATIFLVLISMQAIMLINKGQNGLITHYFLGRIYP
jgi:hypothetical protein